MFKTQHSNTTELNEEEEAQKKYNIAKRGWQKVRKHYFAFMFLKYSFFLNVIYVFLFLGKKTFLWDSIILKRKNIFHISHLLFYLIQL